MPATDIIRGEIKITGVVHGVAINTIVILYEDPPWEFEMKQFVSQRQLEDYASEHHLAIQHTAEQQP